MHSVRPCAQRGRTPQETRESVKVPLQAKATLAIALPVATALAISSWLAYYAARRALHVEMEARITSIA